MFVGSIIFYILSCVSYEIEKTDQGIYSQYKECMNECHSRVRTCTIYVESVRLFSDDYVGVYERKEQVYYVQVSSNGSSDNSTSDNRKYIINYKPYYTNSTVAKCILDKDTNLYDVFRGYKPEGFFTNDECRCMHHFKMSKQFYRAFIGTFLIAWFFICFNSL